MKKPEDYTLDEIGKIWLSNHPGDLTKAYTLLYIKCEELQKQVKNLTIPVVSGSALECYNCGKKMKPEDMYCGKC